jgi:FtsH-binding integral membrane protein
MRASIPWILNFFFIGKVNMAQAQANALPVAKPVAFNRYMALIYLTMALGLGITAFVSQGVYANPDLMRRILFNPWFAFGLFLLQIFLVVGISAAVMRLSPGIAFLLFLLYSALTGVALSSIFIYYSQSTIFYTFWMAAGMFLFCSVAGLFIKRDLSGMGLFLLLALMGWTFGLFLTWFFPFAQGLNQLMNFTGILLFAALAVWDTQRLKIMTAQLEGKRSRGGIVIIGALALYLDFINLFLLLLRTSRR